MGDWIKYLVPRITFLALLIYPVGYFFAVATVLTPMDTVSVGHFEDDRTVVVEQSQLDVVEANYDPDLENAFCVFGDVRDNRFIIDDIEVATVYSRGKGYVSYSCRPNAWERVPEILYDDDQQLIGDIHTHPPRSTEHQSAVDIAGTTYKSLFEYQLRGVYHEDEGANFYTLNSLRGDLDKAVH